MDTRFEWFPKVGEVFAASLFAKRFAKPIEPIILPTSQGVESFQNADGATNVGVELEARKKLDFITPVLSNFTLLANASIIYSQVKIEPKAGQVQTNSERPLAGQSPYLVNAAIDFERKDTRIRLSYNVFGPRLAQVGQLGLPDVYEQPRHLLDLSVAQRLSKSLDMKLSFENLLFAPVRFTQADQLVQRFQPGMTAWLSASLATE